MSLPADWVEYIFSKLVLTYGRDFMSRWEGQTPEVVKDDWAHELDGFEHHPALIEHALKHLPERPPTVVEFRRIARGGPDIQPDQLRIEAPKAASREFVAKLVGQLKPGLVGRKRDPRQWARDLIERHETGRYRSTPVALSMARDALREPTFTTEE
jgi:hypothetical protein